MLLYTLPLSLCVFTGILGFAMGALLQQDASYRGIQSAMANDPYIYRSRQRIYDALKLLGPERAALRGTRHARGIGIINNNNSHINDGVNENTNNNHDIESNINSEIIINDTTTNTPVGADSTDRIPEREEADSVFSNYVRWFQNNMHVVTMFFTFSLDDDELPNAEPTHVATLMKYGFPGLDDIHIYKNFVLSYDRRNRIAHWVCEHLEGKLLKGNDFFEVIEPPEILIDPSIPSLFRASLRDYRNTDWVACHMASPYNYKTDKIKYIETYILPNVAPVSRGLITNVWMRLETYIRELAIKFGSVYVYTGPLYMPQRITFRNWAIRHQVIGMNTVAVPTHFFKVLVVERPKRNAQPLMEGYVVPNVDIDKNIELSAFLSDISDIEHFSGLKFYDGERRPQLHHNKVDKSM